MLGTVRALPATVWLYSCPSSWAPWGGRGRPVTGSYSAGLWSAPRTEPFTQRKTCYSPVSHGPPQSSGLNFKTLTSTWMSPIFLLPSLWNLHGPSHLYSVWLQCQTLVQSTGERSESPGSL